MAHEPRPLKHTPLALLTSMIPPLVIPESASDTNGKAPQIHTMQVYIVMAKHPYSHMCQHTNGKAPHAFIHVCMQRKKHQAFIHAVYILERIKQANWHSTIVYQNYTFKKKGKKESSKTFGVRSSTRSTSNVYKTNRSHSHYTHTKQEKKYGRGNKWVTPLRRWPC